MIRRGKPARWVVLGFVLFIYSVDEIVGKEPF